MMGAVRHYEYVGRPICGAPAEGSFTVERDEHVTCERCVLELEAKRAFAKMLKEVRRVN